MNINNPKPLRNETPDPALEKLSGVFATHAKSVDSHARPGFKHALQMRIQGAREQNRMSKFSFAQFFQGVPGRLAAVGTTALVVILVAVIIFQPFTGTVPMVYAQDNFTLTAEQSDRAGIEATTSFLLESTQPVTAKDVEPLLRSTTDSAFELDQVSDYQVRLRFEEPLPEGEVIQISLNAAVETTEGEIRDRDYGWAFQVKDPFKIVAQIPATQTANVPVNTGIEFTFSQEGVSLESFQKAFSILPEVEGTFEKERDTLIFVPLKLEPQTVYTVTLDGSLSPDGSSDTLGETIITTFETAALTPVKNYFRIYQDLNHFAPEDAISIPFTQRDGNASTTSYQGTIYRFAESKDYAAAVKNFGEMRWRKGLSVQDILGISTIAAEISATFSVVTNDSGYPSESLKLDGELEKGGYLIHIEAEGISDWAFVDISDFVAYYVSAQNEQVLWINSRATQSSVSGVRVTSLSTDQSTTTDNQGIAVLPPLPETFSNDAILIEQDGEVIVMEHENTLYYADASYGVEGWFMNSGDYWAYMYTDRSSYLPSDQIEIWGYLRDRDGLKDVDSVDLVLSSRGYEYNRVEADVVNGFYRATIQTYEYQPGWYGLRVMNGDEGLSNASITILDYVKPAYDLSANLDKEVIKNGESVELSIHGQYFDGTPVKGLGLNIYPSKQETTIPVTLDGSGDARWESTISLPSSGQLYSYQSYTVKPTRAEEGEIQSADSVLVLLTDVYVGAEAEINGTQGRIDFTTHTATKEALLENLYAPKFPLKPNQIVTGEVTEHWSEQVEDGVRYDNITKTTVPKYRYIRHENVVDTFSVTSDANGEVTHTFEAVREDASYRISYRAEDGNGSYYLDTAYAYRVSSEGDYDPYGPLWFTSPGYEYSLGATLGQEIVMQVVRDNVAFTPAEQGVFLYFDAQRGIRDTVITKEPTYTFTFGEEHVPDVYINGVYFDGYGYAVIGRSGWGGGLGYQISLDHSERELHLDVTVPESVRPGEEITATVDVTDAQGKPIEAQVNMNIVDEAYYALFPPYFNPLEVVYSPVLSGVYEASISREIEALADLGAEGGGGGDESGRSEFKDTAAFLVANTDRSGHAEISFTLPDNLTSWRISSQAISLGDPTAPLFVGSDVSNIDATLPYFVVPVMKDSYLDGDAPKIAVRSAGTTLELNDTVEYRLWFQGEDFSEQVKTGTGGETVYFDLPDLATGIYHLTIEGKANGYEDRVTREVSIVSSHIQVPIIETQTLESGSVLSSPTESGMTFVRFMDGSRGKLYGSLAGLSWSYGARADQLLARNVATDLLNAYFGEDRVLENGSAADYQEESGLIRLLPYADTEISLSAKAAFASGTVFDANGLRYGLTSRMDDVESPLTDEEMAWALAGRAALHDPVLLDLRAALEQVDAQNTQVRLPLILGLYYIGATEEARGYYRELTDHSDLKLGARSLGLDDPETNLELTSLVGILAAGLNEPQVDEYWAFLEKTRSKKTTVEFEKTLMLKEWMQHLPSDVPTVEYTLHGERVKETLEHGISDRIVLRPEEFDLLDLVTSGTVVAVTERFGGPDELEGEPSALIGMQREYRVDGQATETFNEGDLVEIRITRTFAEGMAQASYELIDVIPSGLSVVSSPRGISRYERSGNICVNYPRSVVDNRATFYTWAAYNQKGCPQNTTIYYARVVTPGTYEAEPAFLRSYDDPSTYTFSNASEITITE